MRIMQVVSGKEVNGAVLQCLALSKLLAARGHDVVLVHRDGAWIADQVDGTGVELVSCELQRWPLRDLRMVRDMARRYGIHVMHTHMTRAHNFGVCLRWMMDVPCVATAHCRYVQPHWCLNDYVIANSHATFHFHRRWNFVSPSRMSVVNYLLDESNVHVADRIARQRLRAEWDIREHDQVAVVIGDILPRKGQLDAVVAWRQVVDQCPNAKLVIVGRGWTDYEAQTRQVAANLGLDNHIVWAGFRDDIPSVLQACDIVVSAAVEEALGLAIVEGMLAGRAVVATDVGGVPENIMHEGTGLLVPSSSPQSLAGGILRLLENEPLRESLARSARAFALHKYNDDLNIRKVERVYYELAGDRMRASARRLVAIERPGVRQLTPVATCVAPR